jgi:hypothetical protein
MRSPVALPPYANQRAAHMYPHVRVEYIERPILTFTGVAGAVLMAALFYGFLV